MFNTLVSILRGRSERARENLEDTHAVLILEQKIREAQAGHERAKRSLASLILRDRNETRALAGVTARIGDLEQRVTAAIKAEMSAFAEDGAEAIASLEQELDSRRQALDRTRLAAQRLRLMIEKTDRRLAELRQGLNTARAIEAERGSALEMRSDISGIAALVEGEAVLKRALERTDTVEELDILDQIDADLSGDTLVERMAASGLGAPLHTRGEDVLARLKAGLDTLATPSTAPATNPS
jgi:phage shock protein A